MLTGPVADEAGRAHQEVRSELDPLHQSMVQDTGSGGQKFGGVGTVWCCQKTCEALGIRTLCHDIGWNLDIRLELDATAAKGILDRQGISKVRHIDVNCLWLQEQAAKRLVLLVKIPGEINTADLMTKHLSNAVILKHLQNLSLRHVSGRAEMAANLHALQPRTKNKLCKFDRRLKSKKADSFSEREFSGAPRGTTGQKEESTDDGSEYILHRGIPGLTQGRHSMGL